MARILLRNSLGGAERQAEALDALKRLRNLIADIPPADPVLLVRQGRDERKERTNPTREVAVVLDANILMP